MGSCKGLLISLLYSGGKRRNFACGWVTKVDNKRFDCLALQFDVSKGVSTSTCVLSSSDGSTRTVFQYNIESGHGRRDWDLAIWNNQSVGFVIIDEDG